MLRDQGWICRVDRELVGAEELGRDGVLPEGDPGFEVLCIVGAALGEGVERGVGSVAEGAEHACDIFQWRLFVAAFGETAGGFAFKVEDDVVAARAEHLTEGVVAVDAYALTGLARGGRGEGAGAGEELEAAVEDGRARMVR